MEGARPNAAAEEIDESGARCPSCGRTEDPSLPSHARCDRVAVRVNVDGERACGQTAAAGAGSSVHRYRCTAPELTVQVSEARESGADFALAARPSVSRAAL